MLVFGQRSSKSRRMDGRLRKYILSNTQECFIVPNAQFIFSFSLQVNCLSTFYLSLLLLPLMQRTASSFYPSNRPGTLSKPHMTLVTSGLHFLASLSAKSKPEILAAMNVPKGWGADARYNDTKLMVVFWVKALAERVQRASASTMGGGGSVIVNGVNPGFCAGSGVRLCLPCIDMNDGALTDTLCAYA